METVVVAVTEKMVAPQLVPGTPEHPDRPPGQVVAYSASSEVLVGRVMGEMPSGALDPFAIGAALTGRANRTPANMLRDRRDSISSGAVFMRANDRPFSVYNPREAQVSEHEFEIHAFHRQN
jgi:hypothetical protein